MEFFRVINKEFLQHNSYLTFFLYIKQLRQFQDTSYDLFSTVRQCGGSHTLTIPHKKTTKTPGPPEIEATVNSATPTIVKNRYCLTTINKSFYFSDYIFNLIDRTEVQIQGQDGQIYKGRVESRLDAKLSVEMKRPLEMRKHQTRLLKSAPAPAPHED